MKKFKTPFWLFAATQVLVLALSGPVLAQEAATATAAPFWPQLTISELLGAGLVFFGFFGVLLFALVVFFQALPLLGQFYRHPARKELKMARLIGLLRGETHVFTGKVHDVLLTDHDYDGIQEFDNDLPPWWKYLFYVTAVFAVLYLVNFHVLGGKLQLAEYETEMQQAALLQPAGGGNANEQTNFKVLTDASRIEAGRIAFVQNCAACHGQKAEGLVGPNLTDEYWLHGGDVNDVFKTIKFGVTSKGMVAWQGKLTDDQVLEVTSYLLRLQGSNPPNAKPAQGEKFVSK